MAVIGTEIGASIAVMSTNALLEIVVTPPSHCRSDLVGITLLTDHREDRSIGNRVASAAESAPTADKSKIFIMA